MTKNIVMTISRSKEEKSKSNSYIKLPDDKILR